VSHSTWSQFEIVFPKAFVTRTLRIGVWSSRPKGIVLSRSTRHLVHLFRADRVITACSTRCSIDSTSPSPVAYGFMYFFAHKTCIGKMSLFSFIFIFMYTCLCVREHTGWSFLLLVKLFVSRKFKPFWISIPRSYILRRTRCTLEHNIYFDACRIRFTRIVEKTCKRRAIILLSVLRFFSRFKFRIVLCFLLSFNFVNLAENVWEKYFTSRHRFTIKGVENLNPTRFKSMCGRGIKITRTRWWTQN
jgi:hypothetical protein